MTNTPRIVFLDQNKWIELAHAVTQPTEFPKQRALLEAISEWIETGRLMLPLTAANIYETHKINDPRRRHDIAYLQACASKGVVFRGRHRRLETELNGFWNLAFASPLQPPPEPLWFLSDVFFESSAEWEAFKPLGLPITERSITAVRSDPARWLYRFLMATPEDTRIAAIRKFSDGSDYIREQIEERRLRHRSESFEMRRRIYSAIQIINEQETIISIANRLGRKWKSVIEMGEENVRRIVEDVPIYFVEREIAIRLEAQSRAIHENDFRDMQSFCATIPYADEVIGEKQFVNLARQSRLDSKFGTKLSTDLLDLREGLT